MSTRKSKKKSTRINNTLLCILLVVMVAVIGAFSWNIYKVSKKGKVTIKKGIKKGTYKIVIKAKATKNYKRGKKVTILMLKR